jgi:hypothetical protein
LQSLQVLPKSLGTSHIHRYDFKARVGLMPESGRRVDQFSTVREIQGEFR